MKKRIFHSCLLILLSLTGLTSRCFAQTITTGSFTPTTACPGGVISIPYSVSGTYLASNVFSAQLSDVTGIFSANPPVIGTVSSTTAGAITATIPPSTVNGTGYRIRVVSSNPVRTGSNSTLTLSVARPAAPGVTSPASAYCEGVIPPALVATPTAGGTLNWYGPNPTGGTASSVATIPSTSAAAIGSTPYYVSQTISGCESPRVAITVTVTDTPIAPNTSPLTYCVGQSVSALTATPSAGGTLNWYGTNATGGTASSVPPTPPTTATGVTTYYVSQSLGSCEGPRAGLAVTVNAPPPAPTFPASATYCQGATAVALSATGQNLKWYGPIETGGTPSASATVPSTFVAAIGTILYYVTQTVSNCEGPRAAIPVVVRANPATPATTPVPAYCQNQIAAALIATPATGATLNWYGPNATGGTASATPTIPNTAIVGPTNYYVSQSANGCESVRVPMTVTVKATPATPGITTPLVACQNRTGYALTATPATGGTLNWYGTTAMGGTPTATPAPLSTTAVGSITYYVSQSINGCEGPRAGLTVTVNAVPALPTIPASPTYCEGIAASPLSAMGVSLRWYGASATGVSFSPNATVPSTAATAIGTTTYYVTQTVAGCESDRAGIPVLVKDTPNTPGTSAVEFCQGTPVPILNAMPVADASLNWYGTNAAGGTAATTAPVPTNTTVGTTVYYVSQTLVGCEGPRANLSVRVKATPAAPGVSTVSFCNNSTAQQLTASGSSLKWYDAGDNPLAGTPTPDTRTVGNQTFKVSQTSNENCEGPKASLTVIINALPSQPSVAPLIFCQRQEDQPAQNLAPLSAGGQNLRWFSADNQVLPNAPIPTIDRAGKQVYQVSQTVNNCEGAKASLEVSVITPPAPALPKALLTYCINDKATPLEAIGETGSQLRWIDPYGTITGTAPTPSTLNTNIKPNGDEFYVYQIASYGCYSARSTIRVIVNTTPTLSIVAPTGDVNLGQRAPLQLKFTGSGPYSYSITGGYAGTARTDTTISVLPRGNTTYQVAAVTNGCGVGLPGNPASAIITVRVPRVVTSSLAATTLCAGTSLTVPFTTTGDFNTGNTFRIEVVSTADTTKKYAIPAMANASPITGPIPLSLTSGQYFVRVKADNPEIAIIGSNSPTTLTVRSLPSATLTGTQSIYEGSPASLTMTFGGDGPWDVAYADSVRSYTATALTSPYVVEARPTRTTTYRLTSLTNSCGTGPLSSGTAIITVLPLLGVDDNSLDPLVKTYPVPTETTLMVELNLPLTRDPATLTLTDLKGQSIMQQTTRTRLNELNLTAQPSGLYLLRIQVGDRQTVRKVMKQ